jgi:hypothetical protein
MYKRNAGLVSICLLATVAACGTVSAPLTNDADIGTDIDASSAVADASVADASAPDAQTHGTITVRVMIDGNLVPGIPVYTHEVDGSYIDSVLTDELGEVIIDDFPDGGAVTAPVSPFADEFETSSVITSVTGVRLGDVLTIGDSEIFPSEVSTPTIGNASITPPGAQVANATRYRVYIPCRGTSTTTVGATVSLSLREGCINADNTIDAIAIAEDDTGARLAYSTTEAIAVTGVSPSLLASTTMSGWNTDWASLQLNMQNAPFDQIDPEAFVQSFRDGLRIDEDNLPGLTQALNMGEGGSLSANLVPNFNNDVAYVSAIQGTTGLSIVGTREQLALTPNANLSRNVNLSTDMPSVIKSVVVGPSSAPSITWTTLSGTVACKGNPVPDSSVTMVRADTPADGEYVWFVLSQGSTSQAITFPKLDATLALQIWPSTLFTEVLGGAATFSDSVRTYDEIRTSKNNLTYFDFTPTANSSRCVLTSGELTVN